MDIAALDRLRFDYLKRLYELSGGNRRAGVDMWAIGREFDLDRRNTARIFDYLKDAGLAAPQAAGGRIGITHEGIRAVEEALRVPETARQYFPAINIIAIGNMIESQIQQGTNDSTQTMTTKRGDGGSSIREKDEERLAFLHRLYEKVDGSTSRMIPAYDVAADLKFDEQLTDSIVEYLVDEFLVERRAFGDMIGITHAGRTEVEDALRGPREGTEHFAFTAISNVLIADKIEGSQVQMGTVGSTQTMSGADLEVVRQLVRELRTAIGELEFVDEGAATDADADLDSLESQLGRSEPRPRMIRELLTSVRHTLEGAGGGVVAEHADKIADLISKIDQVRDGLPM